MGYMLLMAECGQCGNMFQANPDLVPSLRLEDGRQLVFCEPCIRKANPERVKNGLPPIVPHPDAYGIGSEFPEGLDREW